MSTDHAAEILTLLRRISAQLDQLPTAIAAASAPRRLGPLAEADRELLADALPLLSESIGPRGRVFSAADAIEFLAHQHPESLRQLVQRLGEGHHARLLGRALARAAGHEICGLVVERAKSDRLGALWCIQCAIDHRNDPAIPVDALSRRRRTA